MDNRPYQARAVEHIIEYACDHINGRLLVVGPPGCGKTRIIAEVLRLMAAEQGMRGLAWAHRREIVGQMADHLVENGVPDHLIGVTMAGDPRENQSALIQVASVDTLRHRDKPPADIVVSDEAHRDASEGRRKLRALYPDALHVGFTATPCRLSGGSLRGHYDEMLIVAQPSELIADGWLAAPKIYTVPPELLPDVKRVRRVGGDFDQAGLEQVVNRRALVGSIVDEWKRLAEGRRTIAFPVGIQHSQAIVSRFKAAGIKAVHLDGYATPTERRAILRRLSTGEIQIVSSCAVLSEGVDVPEVKCLILARPTESLALFIQQSGRCMRPWEGVEPIILDHAGNVLQRRHGAPHADRAWSLDDSKGARDGWAGKAVMKRCDGCGLVVHGGRGGCPSCGKAFDMMPLDPPETQHKLVEYRATFTPQQKAKELDRIRAFAAERGFPDEWVGRVYRAKFGDAQPGAGGA